MRAHLAALYAGSGDPWNTRASPYEQHKFARTMASLPRARYRHGLEIGCGAGTLTARLAARCDTLVAMDCTAGALTAARSQASNAGVDVVEGTVPASWPGQPPDLVVLSEVLYFITDAENAGLALRLGQGCAAACDVVLVNWLGDTGGAIGGAAAARRLIGRLGATHHALASCVFARFRIDVLRRTSRLAHTQAAEGHEASCVRPSSEGSGS